MCIFFYHNDKITRKSAENRFYSAVDNYCPYVDSSVENSVEICG